MQREGSESDDSDDLIVDTPPAATSGASRWRSQSQASASSSGDDDEGDKASEVISESDDGGSSDSSVVVLLPSRSPSPPGPVRQKPTAVPQEGPVSSSSSSGDDEEDEAPAESAGGGSSDGSVVVLPSRSPSPPGSLEEARKKLAAQRRVVENNSRLLARSKNLPDGGRRLEEFLRKQKASEAELEAKVAEAKLPSSSSSEEVVETLEMLRGRMRRVNQQFALARTDDDRAALAKARGELSRRILATGALEPNAAWRRVREEMGSMARPPQPQPSHRLYGGRMNEARRNEVVSSIERRLERIEASNESRPCEADEEDDPFLSAGTDVVLFSYQRQGLAWLLWRESQQPSGGIFADDMGLGKTLTLVALVLKSREVERSDADGPTLVVCPASLISHWEAEAKKGRLRVLVYHGPNREPRGLSRQDVVVTTYGTVVAEAGIGRDAAKGRLDDLMPVETEGGDEGEGGNRKKNVLGVAWRRLILDEAHQVRNPRSQTARAVCRLRARSRWAVTGTPVQNKELDLYSLVRFLRVDPFDEYRVWKLWVENKTSMGQARMNALMQNLLLRRTKGQVSAATGRPIVELPPKSVVEHRIALNPAEKALYDKVFGMSRKAMLGYMGGDDDVKTHRLLVMLLRLRQICCHPALAGSAIEGDLGDGGGDDDDLSARMESMNIEAAKGGGDDELGKKFPESAASSKIERLLEEVEARKADGEKVVVVSQWSSMLRIVKSHLERRGFRTAEISGSVPVKSRGDVVRGFNDEGGGGPQVMLLSLGAGGVGLNLVAANHLFLLDMHWNPQLESQASDRIYRVGQRRPVTVHRFLCEDTVEASILQLQKKKLDLADGILGGARRADDANRLTMQDLKAIFGL